MGYATVMNVPRVYSYQYAKTILEGATPIRGRSPELRPMAERRYADTYSIRMGADECIECVCYKTPVVTFKPDDTVVVWMGNWDSASTRQFISRVLGVGVQGKQGHTLLSLSTDNYYAMARDEKLTLRRTSDGYWEVVDAKAKYTYSISRVKANSVRARYKPFFTYVNNMLKLRKEHADSAFIEIRKQEVAPFNIKPYSNYSIEMRELVVSGDESKHYEAFLWLAVSALPGWYVHRLLMDENYVARAQTKFMLASLREVFIEYHADEVMDKVELAQGKAPNAKYVAWVEAANKRANTVRVPDAQ